MKKDEQELIPIAHLNERDIEFYAGITVIAISIFGILDL